MGANWSAPIRNIFSKNKKEDQVVPGQNVEVVVKEPADTPKSNLADELKEAEEKLKKTAETEDVSTTTPEKPLEKLGQSLKFEKEQMRNEFYKVGDELEQEKDKIFTKLDEKICNLKKTSETKKDEITSTIQDEKQVISDEIHTAIDKVQEAVSSLGEKFEKSAEKVKDKWTEVSEKLESGKDQIESQLNAKIEQGQNLIFKNEQTISQNITGLKEDISTGKDNIISGISEGLNEIHNKGSGAINTKLELLTKNDEIEKIAEETPVIIKEETESVIGLQKEIQANKTELIENVTSNLQKISTTGTEEVSNVLDSMKEMLISVEQKVEGLTSNLHKLEESAREKVTSGAQDIMKTTGSVREYIEEKICVRKDEVSDVEEKAGNNLQDMLKSAETFKDELDEKKDDLLGDFASNLQKVGTEVSKNKDKVTSDLEDKLKKAESIEEVAIEKRDNILTDFTSTFQEIGHKVSSGGESLKLMLDSTFEKVQDSKEHLINDEEVQRQDEPKISTVEKEKSMLSQLKESFSENREAIQNVVSNEFENMSNVLIGLKTELVKENQSVTPTINIETQSQQSEDEDVFSPIPTLDKSFGGEDEQEVKTLEQAAPSEINSTSYHLFTSKHDISGDSTSTPTEKDQDTKEKSDEKKTEEAFSFEDFKTSTGEFAKNLHEKVSDKTNELVSELSKLTGNLKDTVVEKKEVVTSKLENLGEKFKETDVFSKISSTLPPPMFQSTQQPLTISEEEHTASLKKQKELEEKVLEAQRAFENSTLLTEDFLKNELDQSNKDEAGAKNTLDFLCEHASNASHFMEKGLADLKNETGNILTDLNTSVTRSLHFGATVHDENGDADKVSNSKSLMK